MQCDTCLKTIDKRTTQQNRALYLYFKKMSEACNDTGVTFSEYIKKRPRLDMMWTPERVKEIWKEAQVLMYGTTSTAKLKKDEIDKIFDVVNKAISEITGVYVPFPSIESLTEL